MTSENEHTISPEDDVKPLPPEIAAVEPEDESFKSMFEASLRAQPSLRKGQMVKGMVVGCNSDAVMMDVGFKHECAVPRTEFETLGIDAPEIGSRIHAMVMEAGGRNGVKLSVLAAKHRAVWQQVEQAMADDTLISATINKEIKGGYQVDIGGMTAFLPRSEADIVPHTSAQSLLGTQCDVAILTATRRPENIVVSRKKPLEDERKKQQHLFFESTELGAKISGEVKRLTDFGAFVDVGGVDALLHISDISWRKVKHPSELLTVGQKITAEIIKLNEKTGKISLSMRVLQADPWGEVDSKYTAGMRLTGTIRRLLDFGAMVEIEPGVDGMIHRSEMSWTHKDVKPDKLLNENDVVDVMVLDVNAGKRRIALSLKAVMENPWQTWLAEHPVGSKIKGLIRSKTEFGMFIGLNEHLDGLVHIGALSWDKQGEEALGTYTKGQEVEAVVLGVDIDRQRISLGIKQLDEDPLTVFLDGTGRGSRVEGDVVEINADIAMVKLADGIQAVLPMREYPREDPALEVGSHIDAKIIEVNRKRRQIRLSVRQLLQDEERNAVKNYGKNEGSTGVQMSALALALQAQGLGKKKKRA